MLEYLFNQNCADVKRTSAGCFESMLRKQKNGVVVLFYIQKEGLMIAEPSEVAHALSPALARLRPEDCEFAAR